MKLQPGSYRKAPNKDEKYRQVLLQVDVAGEEQDVPMARRRCIFPQALEQKMTPCGRKVVGPRTPESLHPTPPAASPSFFFISGFINTTWIRHTEIQRGTRRTRRSSRTASAQGSQPLDAGAPENAVIGGGSSQHQNAHHRRHRLQDTAGMHSL